MDACVTTRIDRHRSHGKGRWWEQKKNGSFAYHPTPIPGALIRKLAKGISIHFWEIKLATYPSPKPTLTLTSHLGQNVGSWEG